MQLLEACIRNSNLPRTRRVIAGTLVYFLSPLHRKNGISCNKMKHILCINKIWYKVFKCINGCSVLRLSLSEVLPFFTAQ